MRYLGGKFRILKPLVEFLNTQRKPNQDFMEPFVGAAWVVSSMRGKRYASDNHPDLILLYKALQCGWIPPENISEKEYNDLRNGSPSAIRGFVGFGCSFAGKWFGGYARTEGRNYAANAKNSLLKIVPAIQSVIFSHQDYSHILNVEGKFIYCDPPYEGTTNYSTGRFDWGNFWKDMEQLSKCNSVFISSYSAPPPFKTVAEFKTKTDMAAGQKNRTEKLFSL